MHEDIVRVWEERCTSTNVLDHGQLVSSCDTSWSNWSSNFKTKTPQTPQIEIWLSNKQDPTHYISELD